MINIYFNQQECYCQEAISLQDFLMQHHHLELHFAIAINQQFIPRARYPTTILSAGDCVDLIVPMQGG